MQKEMNAISDDISTLAEDARALMTATSDATGEKVVEARRRLSAALDGGKRFLGRVKEKAVAGVEVADEAFHTHPYQAIGIALGVGALVGYLIVSRRSRNSN